MSPVDSMVGIWVVAAFFLTSGLALAMNYKNAAQRMFDLAAKAMPFTGTATPKTLRFMGAGWVFLALAMTVPEFFVASE